MAQAGDSKAKTEEEKQAEAVPSDEEKPFTVSDRRHWARRQQGEELAEPVETAERLPTYVEELKAQMEEKDATLREYIASYKTAKEEMEAARARMAQDMDRRLERHKQEFFAGLLHCLDNLERAVAAGENHQDYDGLLQGVMMVRDLFLQKLGREHRADRCRGGAVRSGNPRSHGRRGGGGADSGQYCGRGAEPRVPLQRPSA